MIRKLCFLVWLGLMSVACTKEKTDYEAGLIGPEIDTDSFSEFANTHSGALNIRLESLNGKLYVGYNEIRLEILNESGQQISDKSASVNMLPILTSMAGESRSAPHSYNLVYNSESNYFYGYAVFPEITQPDQNWVLYIDLNINGNSHQIQQNITVENQTNKNLGMARFTGNDGEQYFIALMAPSKPQVSENELIAGIYKYDRPIEEASLPFPDPTQFSFSKVQNHTLLLDPRMPEPSMGNHSSPNNKDLIQREDGLYTGIVNYTMTGNWTLNFMLLDQNNQVLKGTKVPEDFTPGVQGAKSELHIDILF